MPWIIRRQIKVDDYTKRDVYYKGSDYIRSGPPEDSWTSDFAKAAVFDDRGAAEVRAYDLRAMFMGVSVVKHIG